MFGLPEGQTALAGGDGEVSQSRNLLVIKEVPKAAGDASMSPCDALPHLPTLRPAAKMMNAP